MRTVGVVATFLLLGLFALIMAGQFIGFATAGTLSDSDAQSIFDTLPTVAYMAAAVGFGLFVIAAFYQFIFKHGRR